MKLKFSVLGLYLVQLCALNAFPPQVAPPREKRNTPNEGMRKGTPDSYGKHNYDLSISQNGIFVLITCTAPLKAIIHTWRMFQHSPLRSVKQFFRE